MSRIIGASENFKVLPSLGQIGEGYLLVLPTEHYLALADMPVAMLQGLAAVMDAVRTTLLAAYGPCIFFEHGARSDLSGGCGIYHAHLHAVPVAQVADPVTQLRRRFKLERISGIEKIGGTIGPVNSYLYYQDLNSKEYVCRVDHLPSQYMRKLLAEALGKPSWDWREFGREDALISTISRLTDSFATTTFSHPVDKATGEEPIY